MNPKEIVKKDLLRRKINEYFSKNPNSNSVIIRADVGDMKTHWKVVKEGKDFNIIEVNTNTKKFIFEDETVSFGKKPQVQPNFKRDHIVPPPLPSKLQRAGNAGFDLSSIINNALKMDDKTFGQAYGMPKKSIVKQYLSEPEIIIKLADQVDDFNFRTIFNRSKQEMLKYAKDIQTRRGPPELDKKRAAQHAKTKVGPPPMVPNKIQTRSYGTVKTNPNINAGKKCAKGKELKEASAPFSNITKAFMNYSSNLGDHNAANNFVNTLNRQKGMITDPTEKDAVDKLLMGFSGEATKTADQTAHQSPLLNPKLTAPKPPLMKPFMQNSGKKIKVKKTNKK